MEQECDSVWTRAYTNSLWSLISSVTWYNGQFRKVVAVVAVHTFNTVYHDDSLEDAIHVRCFTFFLDFRDLSAVKIQQIRPNHCSCTPSIIERARKTRCWEAWFDHCEIPKVGKRCWRTAGASLFTHNLTNWPRIPFFSLSRFCWKRILRQNDLESWQKKS